MRPSRCLGMTAALAVALAVPYACSSSEASRGSARAVGRTSGALTTGELLSVNGTYGASCQSRSGAWSAAIAVGALLDNPALSVLLGDAACTLTMTGLHTTSGILAAMPVIPLTGSYQSSPSTFGSPVDFYANAELSAVSFASDFVLSILFSDDPNLATADNTAIATSPTVASNTPLAGAVNMSINTSPDLLT